VQAACAQTGEVATGTPLDNAHVDARQRQLARQHQSGRARAHDHHRIVGHRGTPVISAAIGLGLIVLGGSLFVLFSAVTAESNRTYKVGGTDAGSRQSVPRSDRVDVGCILMRY
jgi:hypothetical protein